eukprot:3727948-Rhodomonas_salina.2
MHHCQSDHKAQVGPSIPQHSQSHDLIGSTKPELLLSITHRTVGCPSSVSSVCPSSVSSVTCAHAIALLLFSAPPRPGIHPPTLCKSRGAAFDPGSLMQFTTASRVRMGLHDRAAKCAPAPRVGLGIEYEPERMA